MSNRFRMGIRVVTIAVALSQATAAAPAQRTLPQELSWVGLYNSELLEWLENENRLDELCAKDPGSERSHACRAALLEPKVAVIPVRSEPRVTARRLGQIVLVAWPGEGFRLFASSGRVAQPFTPDLFDSDWGYGPYFHQTILARRGFWFRVPVPVIGTGWINAEEWSDRGEHAWEKVVPEIETVEPGGILTSPRGDLYVLGVEKHFLRARPEQETDMACDGDQKPPAPYKEIRIPFEQLFDAKGHLLVSVKYMRGC